MWAIIAPRAHVVPWLQLTCQCGRAVFKKCPLWMPGRPWCSFYGFGQLRDDRYPQNNRTTRQNLSALETPYVHLSPLHFRLLALNSCQALISYCPLSFAFSRMFCGRNRTFDSLFGSCILGIQFLVLCFYFSCCRWTRCLYLFISAWC